MKRIYILGAGALARELESWLTPLCRVGELELAGFLYSGTNRVDEFPSDLQVVGDWQNFQFSAEDAILLGIADSEWKKRIFDALHDKVEFFTFIHPSVLVGKFSKIGAGSVILPNSLVSCNVQIGTCVTINTGSQFGHDSIIDDFSSVMSNVDFGGWCTLGKHSFVGTGSTIIPKTKIGSHVSVGAGSVVVRDIPDNWHVFGNPAQRLLVPSKQ